MTLSHINIQANFDKFLLIYCIFKRHFTSAIFKIRFPVNNILTLYPSQYHCHANVSTNMYMCLVIW